MTRQELGAFCPPGVAVDFGGLKYAVPTLARLTGSCYAAFKKRLFDEDLQVWKVKWQCRDFVRAFACFVQECNADTQNTPDGDDACAVGEFWFYPDGNPPGLGHAVCICVTDEGLKFLDPQTNLVRIMSETELLSCAFLRW